MHSKKLNYAKRSYRPYDFECAWHVCSGVLEKEKQTELGQTEEDLI